MDSNEQEKKRDIEESEEEVGAVEEKEKNCAGGEGQGEGRGSKKGKRGVEKKDERSVRVEESKRVEKRKEREKREDRVGESCRDVKGGMGSHQKEGGEGEEEGRGFIRLEERLIAARVGEKLKKTALEGSGQVRQKRREKGKEERVLCGRWWEEVKGAGRETEKGECKERSVSKKLRKVVGEEGG